MRRFEAGKFHNVSKWEEEESRKNHTVIIMSIFIISRRLEMAESSTDLLHGWGKFNRTRTDQASS